MASITFKGTPIKTIGELPQKGSRAPNFSLVANDLSEVTLESFGRKKKILNIIPSLDTGVCRTSANTFNEKIARRSNLVVINISMDLPFAQGRFCKVEDIDNSEALSAFRSSFPKDYGVEIMDGPLKGLCARAVIVLDENNNVVYTEQVPEIGQEPNYDKALQNL